MAQLVLNTASAIANSGIGQAVARSAASSIANFAASTVSSLIFGPTKRRIEGPRLESFQVQASTEGAPIVRVFGRARLSGQVIWAANFKETVAEEVESGKGARLGTQTTTVSYIYSISLAIGLCEGEIARIGRVWADGKPFDLSPHNVRIYQGTEDQTPDPVIEIVEGASNAPAYRGLAYIVFEDLDLTEFGNRIPQFSFEVERPLKDEEGAHLENQLSGVTIIPGSGEFSYGTTPVTRELAPGAHVNENVNNNQGGTDFTISMEALQGSLPNVGHASLIVSWFGTDLRADQCQVHPGVETRDKSTFPYEWQVSGQTRETAYEISTLDGAPSYGGTPSDRAVIEALRDMSQRGLQVMVHPFILMDIPPGANLPDPSGLGTQGAYPWRGRISAQAGSAATSTSVDAFFGSAKPDDFSLSGQTVLYHGAEEWSFRRMILHMAYLCRAAQIGTNTATQTGPIVNAFLLGSELRGLTTLRDETGAYPAVEALRQLAGDVRSILGPDVALSYGADWSEYHGHQPSGLQADAPGDKIFHLDALWADDTISFIGVDNYLPLADWRDGSTHLDAVANADNGSYSLDYLQRNIQGGEGYDWFYATDEDRDGQIRTPITDGAYHEPWVYRAKDFWNWWQRPHHDRRGGMRSAVPTAWVPGSKPIRFTELGCPAVDKGANQPNVFVDPKSAESALPYFSNGQRDDLAQRRFLEAHMTFWRDTQNNPVSSVYQGAMVDPDRVYVYAWDGRPYPDFPARADIWGDTQNWVQGHWLNGRVGKAPLGLLVEALAAEAGFYRINSIALEGLITGYVIDRPLSPREMIDPLADVFQFDMVETGGAIRFQPRYQGSVAGESPVTLSRADLVANDQQREGTGVSTASALRTLGQAIDLPSAFRLGFLDENADFTTAVATARDPGLRSAREDARQIPAVLPMEEAEARARSILADAWVMRERISFTVPASYLDIEAGDVIIFTDDEGPRSYRITDIRDGAARAMDLVRLAPSVYDTPAGAPIFRSPSLPTPAQAPLDWTVLDLPVLAGDDSQGDSQVSGQVSGQASLTFAAYGSPWPGGAVVRREGAGADARIGQAATPSVIGRLAAPAPDFEENAGRWVRQTLHVTLPPEERFVSRDLLDILGGANALALEAQNGGVEIIQFERAHLSGPGQWQLTNLLRAQAGTEDAARAGAIIGARIVGLGGARGPNPVEIPLDLLGVEQTLRAGPAHLPADHPAHTKLSVTPQGRSLMPLSPVHLRAFLQNDGGIQIEWLRRTRIGGDRWEAEDVSLGEAFERYRVEVMAGNTVLRSQDVDSAIWNYPFADYSNDQEAANALDLALRVRVRQVSDQVGPGLASAPLALINL